MEQGPGGPWRGCGKDQQGRVSCSNVRARCWHRLQENVQEGGKSWEPHLMACFLCTEEAHHSGFAYRRSKPIKIPSQHFTPNINAVAFNIMLSIVRRDVNTICASKSSVPSMLQKIYSRLYSGSIDHEGTLQLPLSSLVQAAIMSCHSLGGL